MPNAKFVELDNCKLSGNNFFVRNMNRDVAYLKLLDADRVLFNFRATFHVDTKNAIPLGGWEEPAGLLRGHSLGHFLSALSLCYASTKLAEIKSKLDYIVSCLASLQKLTGGRARDFITKCSVDNVSEKLWNKNPEEWGSGYLASYSPDQFALLELFVPYPSIWAPYYTMHKLIAGLLDAYNFTNNKEALEVAKKLALWIYDRLINVSEENRQKMWSLYIAGEYGGLNESLVELYIITKDERYFECALMFDNKKLFDALAKNIDAISHLHANQHIPQIIGALKIFEAKGNKKYYDIAKNFWLIAVEHYSYCTGGMGTMERWQESDKLAKHIDSDKNCETCAAYNMLKLTQQLYLYDMENCFYMDYYERTLINQIAASQNPIVTESRHNGVTYMLPISPGCEKEYSDDYNTFTCCHGTGMENHVKYPIASTFIDNSKMLIYVNIFMEQEIFWKDKEICIKEYFDYFSGKLKLVINFKNELINKMFFTFKIRIPYWNTNDYTVNINNKKIDTVNAPSTYLTLSCEWQKQDTIEIDFAYSLKIEKTIDKLNNKKVINLLYGPFVMVEKCSKKEWQSLILKENINECFSVKSDGELPLLTINNREFIPMLLAHNIPYHTYFLAD